MRRVITSGETFPKGYGVAYQSDFSRTVVCYPIPLNWLVRWWREFVDALRVPQSRTRVEEIFDRGYKLGREHERDLVESRLARAREQGRDEGYRAFADALRLDAARQVSGTTNAPEGRASS